MNVEPSLENSPLYPHYFFVLANLTNCRYYLPIPLSIFAQVVSVLTAMLFGFAIWMILNHTPKEMRTHRWFLVLYLSVSFAYEFEMFALSRPVILTPLIMIRTFGPLSKCLGVPIQFQMCVLSATICLMATSLTSIFYYRLHVFLGDSSWLKVSPRLLPLATFLWNALPASATTALLYVVLPSDDQTFDFLEQVLPRAAILAERKMGLITVDEFTTPLFPVYGFVFVFVVLISSALAVAFSIGTICVLNFRFHKHNLTEATHRRQVRVQRNLIIMSVIPAASLLPPLFVFFYCTLLRPPGMTKFLNASVVLSCLHAPCVCVLVVLLNTAYRRATKRIFLNALVRMVKAGFQMQNIRHNQASPESSPSFSS